MKKGWIIVICLFIVIVLGALALIFIPGPKVANAPTQSSTANTGGTTLPHAPTPDLAPTDNTASIADLLAVSSPAKNQKITSPLSVTGSARGTFYFEATFPIKLKDASGKVLAEGHAQAQGDWTTTEFVPFAASLSYPAQPAGSLGTLILMNDNPSGDPSKQQELDIPVTFN